MGLRRLVYSSFVVAVVAAAATRAHAQGVLQTTYDRGSWPDEYEKRTIVIPQQMWELDLQAGVQSLDTGGRGTSLTEWALTPTVAYGLNRNVTIGAAQTSLLFASSGTDAMGNPVSDTSTQFGQGDVFAIARPFNDYDVGFRVDVPFIPNDPTQILVGLHFIGHVSISLDRLSLFFDTGVRFKAFADDTDVLSTQYAGAIDLVYQINPQLALTGGGAFTKQTFDSGGQPFTIDDQNNFDLRAAVYYALGNGVDIYGRLGDQLGDFGGPYALTGVTLWR